jgi:hypothetical protein
MYVAAQPFGTRGTIYAGKGIDSVAFDILDVAYEWEILL